MSGGYGTLSNIVQVTGAASENAEENRELRGIDQPAWKPWAAQVMILAGESPLNLWLGCRNCGWFLGYSTQIDPDYMAEAARRHRESCRESKP